MYWLLWTLWWRRSEMAVWSADVRALAKGTSVWTEYPLWGSSPWSGPSCLLSGDFIWPLCLRGAAVVTLAGGRARGLVFMARLLAGIRLMLRFPNSVGLMRAVALKYYLSHSLPSRDAPQRLWRGPRVFTLSHREKGENCHRPHRWAWSNAPHWSTGASTCMLYYTFVCTFH